MTAIYDPVDCATCEDDKLTCEDQCRSASCAKKCKERYGDCTKTNECEWFPDECTACVINRSSCKSTCDDDFDKCETCVGADCPSDCGDLRTSCKLACDNGYELCWATEDCQPYTDVTSICNYLDRGISDFGQFEVADYTVRPAGIKTLADIEMLEFGLDLPETKCEENPHGIPCTDEDYRNSWFIDEVELSLGGVVFFAEQKGVLDQFLKAASGGAGDAGITGWDSTGLRLNPQWGISEDEFVSLSPVLPMPKGAAQPEERDFILAFTSTLTSDRLAQIVEGVVGQALSAFMKTGSDHEGCKGTIFCDNKRKEAVFFRRGECDFGGCPPANQDLGSPTVEVRGLAVGDISEQDRVEVSVDFTVGWGVPDLSDCEFGNLLCGSDESGTTYYEFVDYDLRIEYEPSCVWTGDQVCQGHNDCSETQVCNIDSGETEGLCQTAQLKMQPEFRIIRETDSVLIDILDGIIDLNGKIQGPLEEFIEAFTIASDLTSCPSVVAQVSPGGNIDFNLSANTFSTDRTMPSDLLVRWARIMDAPGTARADLESAVEKDVDAIDIAANLPSSVVDAIAGPPLPHVKLAFSTIDDSLNAVCALTGYDSGDFVCSPDMNLALVALPPPNVGSLTSGPLLCDTSLPPGNAANDEACEDLAQVKAFFMQAEVYRHCIDVHPNGSMDPNATMVAIWDSYLAGVEKCFGQKLSSETLIPAALIDLKITTGREPASQTFPFVTFTDAGSLSYDEHQAEKCKNRIEFELDIDPPSYSDCEGDVDDPGYFGDIGCRCADVEANDLQDLLIDGGYPDGLGSFVAHNGQGPGQYCRDELNSQLVCGKITQANEHYAICQRCGTDTNVGCDCDRNSDCGGIEDNLRCVGSVMDEGWAPGGKGTCLPDPGTPAGQEALEEVPWFCLDNCGSIDFAGSNNGVCYYSQLDIQAEHGTCVSALAGCKGGAIDTHYCEIQDGLMCKQPMSGDVCEQECSSASDCAGLGFPDHYVCDSAGGFTPGHCVPEQCVGNGVSSGFCNLYR